MMQQIPPTVMNVFHGKPPRIFWRMLYGRARAWGTSARAPREKVQDILRTIGLQMQLEEHRWSSDRGWLGFNGKPKSRSSWGRSTTYKVGVFVQAELHDGSCTAATR